MSSRGISSRVPCGRFSVLSQGRIVGKEHLLRQSCFGGDAGKELRFCHEVIIGDRHQRARGDGIGQAGIDAIQLQYRGM